MRPVWTGPAWTIVLAGATSQWKRSDCGSAAIAPPWRVAVRDVLDRAQQRADLGGLALGRERRQQRLVEVGAGAEEAQRAAEQHDAGVDRLAALDPRDHAQRGVLEGLALHRATRARSASSTQSRGASSLRGEELGVRRPRRPTPAARARRPRRRPPARPGARRPRRSRTRSPSSTWSRIAGNVPRARSSGSGAWKAYRAAPWSIRYRFECQRSRFGLRGVRSTLVISESSQTTFAASSGSGGRSGLYGSEPGRKSTPRLMPGARRDQLLDLGVGLGVAQRGVELDQHQLGDRQPERAGELAGHDLRRQRLRALPGAAELEDVEAVVVGLDDARQRASLAQGRHVARRGHRAQHGWHDG